MKACLRRRLLWWMVWASKPLPTPVSPNTNTLVFVSATCSTFVRSLARLALRLNTPEARGLLGSLATILSLAAHMSSTNPSPASACNRSGARMRPGVASIHTEPLAPTPLTARTTTA